MDAREGSAAAASELLAFYREPAVHRPRYLHGEAPLPEGRIVLRLALGRFPGGLDAWPAASRRELREAARAFVRQVCLRDRATHYQVLCVPADASPGSIRENYQLLMVLVHPDRREEKWPADCAQRVNGAYAVLGDPERRARYDEDLARGSARPAPESASASPGAARAPRLRPDSRVAVKRFALVGSVLAVLFALQAWWVGIAPKPSPLDDARPQGGWMREVLPDPPRFLGIFTAGERLPPLEEPRRLAKLSAWAPADQVSAAAEPPAVAPGRVSPPLATSHVDSLPAARPPPASEPPAPAPIRLAQAGPAKGVLAAAPSREQVEGVVALLIGYYEDGDAGRLAGLLDTERLGFWDGNRARAVYTDFFNATRERRLRMERLSWQPAGGVARARGEATVMAEYNDGRPRLHRRVPVELDIELRDGKPRIARLVLYPAS